MTFVIYHNETTRTHMTRKRRHSWLTEAAAKAERTRSKLDPAVWLIDTRDHFESNIEKTETVYSIHDLKKEHPIQQSVNTPAACDPSTETYWSI